MTDNRTTDRVDHSPRVRDAIDELMHKKDASDNRTTELLREGLTERGVEYEAYKDIKNRCITKWRTYHGAFVFFAVEEEGKLFVETASDTEHSAICTPEQAIAATLGSEREKELESLVWFMEPFFKSAVSHECGCPVGYFKPHGCDDGCMALKELDKRMVALGLLEVD